jgi:SPP1 family predicted phage head-tail adaptor
VRIGALKHYVTIQQLTSSLDANGNTVEAWTDVASVWADITPLSAREFIAAQGLQSQVVARITIRHRTDVRASMRINHGGVIYNIAGVLADAGSGREYLTLPCSQGTNDG